MTFPFLFLPLLTFAVQLEEKPEQNFQLRGCQPDAGYYCSKEGSPSSTVQELLVFERHSVWPLMQKFGNIFSPFCKSHFQSMLSVSSKSGVGAREVLLKEN